MARTVGFDVDDGLATLRLSREHGNAINGDLATDLAAACREAGERADVRGVLLAASGKLFCPGLDLQELIELDRDGLVEFIGRFRDAVLALYALERPVVAAIHGHAVAGGCVLALCADRRLLRQGARIGLAEVRVGLPFPYEVATVMREGLPATSLEEIALYGRDYEGADAVAAGLVHEVLPGPEFETACRERLADLASRDTHALGLTKRYLRGPAIERICREDPRRTAEFVDAWFRPATQDRIRAVVERLRRG
jgi:enoyl-CoA hydratase